MSALELIFSLSVLYSYSSFHVEGALSTESMVYWSNATVPFYINGQHYDEQQTQIIIRALDRFNSATCLKFVPVFTLSPSARMLYINNPTGVRKCVFKAKSFIDEPHNLVLGYDCLLGPHIDMLIMRSLGFNFEHNRPGRDIYISVLVENIEPGCMELYTKDLELPPELRELAYDYNSVMHFSERDHSKNGHRTLLFKNKAVKQRRAMFSATDLRKVEIVYGPHCRLRDRNDQIAACNKFIPAEASRRRRRHASQRRAPSNGGLRTRQIFEERRGVDSTEAEVQVQSTGTSKVHLRTVHYGPYDASEDPEARNETSLSTADDTTAPTHVAIDRVDRETNASIDYNDAANGADAMAAAPISNAAPADDETEVAAEERPIRRMRATSRYKNFFLKLSGNVDGDEPATQVGEDAGADDAAALGTTVDGDGAQNASPLVTMVDPATGRPSTAIDRPRVRPMTSVDPPEPSGETGVSLTDNPSTTIDPPVSSETGGCGEPGSAEQEGTHEEEQPGTQGEIVNSSEAVLRSRKKHDRHSARLRTRIRRAMTARPLRRRPEDSDEAIPLFGRTRSEEAFRYDRINMTAENRKYYQGRIWPDGVVPYVIADNGFDKHLVRRRLNEVNQILKQKTCVKLREYSTGEASTFKDYLTIDTTKDFEPGRVGGKQHFGAEELFQKGQSRQLPALMVMSMLGFNFECSRHDRDNFVAVYYNNIVEGKEAHFERMPEGATLRLPYDFSSASHPTWKFWRKPLIHNRSTVATLKRMDPDTRIMRNLGENEKILSIYDIQKINTVYDCRNE